MTDPKFDPTVGQRSELPESPTSEHRDGGLLAIGTRVRVVSYYGSGFDVTGHIVDTAGTPAAYLSIDRGNGSGRAVVFVGPGVVVEPAPSWSHPAL